MKKKSFLLITMLFFSISWICAQQKTITGTVIEKGLDEPILGATVTIKGTTTGTATDMNGNFTISAKPGDVLNISYIGFLPQSITVGESNHYDIIMSENTQSLDEVVVVGYATQKKVNITGSVSSVGTEVLESRPVQNVGQALQGVIPGLNFSVTSGGGALDNNMSVNIRGTGSIGDGSSSDPLVLIDGIEGDMNTVNPNDIENISVLKDAASASIYGARASFGVILITTKAGRSGKTNVSYTGNVRFTDALQVPEMMDSYQFAQYFNAAAANAGQSAVFTDAVMQRIQDYQAGKISYGTVPNAQGRWNNYTGANANTDWFAEMYKDWVPSHEHNLSVSGGTEKLTYRVSGNFMNQNGLIRHGKDKFNRYTMDAKISAKLTDWATLNYTSKWTREDYSRPTYMTGLFFHNIARRWPTCPAYTPTSYINDEGETVNLSQSYLQEGVEIIQMEDGGVQTQKKNYYTQQLGFVFEPIKDWFIHADGNMRTYNYNQHYEVLPVYAHDMYENAYAISWDGGADYAAGQSRVYEYRRTEDYFTTNIYTDYSKTFGDHYAKIMVGFNGELTKYNQTSGRGDGLISSSAPYLDVTTTLPKVSGGVAENSLAGFFGRLNYNYQEKYMFEANLRYDGASRFVGDNQWGLFPSFSAGWNIAKEKFFGSLSNKISTLKLRGSWGQLGNNRTSSWYPFYQTMPVNTAYSAWLVDGQKINTSSLPGIVSSMLTWETVESWDIGLEWAALNNRLTGQFDYFNRYTYDMVGPAPTLASVLGAAAPKINNADMKSYGFDFELGWNDHINEFQYGVKLVLSDAQQEILKYPNDFKSISQYYVGRKMGEIWGYQTVGIAQTQAEMDAHLANNKPSWGSNWSAGDIMYADLNGDGVINEGANTVDDPGDRKIIGNSTPRFNYGVTLDAAYVGFDIRAFFQGVAKRDYWLSGPYFFGASGGMWQSAGFKNHWDFWRAEGDPLGANTGAYYPRASFDGTKNQYTQTKYLQNAAYLRLKNIQLGYTIPRHIVNKAGMQSVRVYVSGDNLLTFSDITGIFDPETLGGDWGDGKLYPLCKTISIGLNVNF